MHLYFRTGTTDISMESVCNQEVTNNCGSDGADFINRFYTREVSLDGDASPTKGYIGSLKAVNAKFGELFEMWRMKFQRNGC